MQLFGNRARIVTGLGSSCGTCVSRRFHSVRSIEFFLKKEYGSGSVPNGQSLYQNMSRNKLDWAIKHCGWTAEDWEDVIWRDECAVEQGRNSRQRWVFRRRDEKWLPECVQPITKGKGVSLMVWGCFLGGNRGTFVPLIIQ